MSAPHGLILLAVSESTGPPVAGAVVITADCGHQAWIAPSGLQAQLSLGLRTSCAACLPDGPKEVVELPGAREELEQAIGAERATFIVSAVIEQARRGGRI